MNDLDQIAAEAVKQIEKCLPEGALRGSTTFVGLEVMAIQSIIQVAIEKAYALARKEIAENNAAMARTSHATRNMNNT